MITQAQAKQFTTNVAAKMPTLTKAEESLLFKKATVRNALSTALIVTTGVAVGFATRFVAKRYLG